MFSSLFKFGKKKKSLEKSSRSTKRFKSLASRHLMIENLENRELLSICTWTGGGGNNNWSNSANWDVVPVAGRGDDLVFAGTNGTSKNNDFTAGSSFNSITFASSGVTLTGNAITLSSGITVNNGAGGSSIALSGIALSGTVTVDLASYLSISCAISGSGGLTETGASTLSLSGLNTYTGGTTISGGNLLLYGGSLIGNITNNSSLVFVNFTSKTYSDVISGTGSVEIAGSPTATLTFSGNNTYSGNTMIDSSTSLQIGSDTSIPYGSGKGNVTVTGNLDLNGHNISINGLSGGGMIKNTAASAATLTAGYNNQTSTYSGVIQNGTSVVNLIKAGTGTLTLTGNNTYTGATTINQGTISVSSESKLGNATTPIILGDDSSHKGTLSYSGAALTRGFTINNGGGEIDTTSNSQTLTISTGGIYVNGPLTIGGPGNTSISSDVWGEGAWIKSGSGTLTFSGNVSRGSETEIDGGTLRLGNDETLGYGNVTMNGGTLDLGGYSAYIGSLSGSGQIGNSSTLANSVLTIHGSGTFSGVISDALLGLGSKTTALYVGYYSTQTLTGNNTYTGGTTISSNGSLQIGNGITSGSIVGNIINNGSLTFNRSDAIAYAGVISGSGSVTQIGTGTLTLTGNNNYSGGTTISNGTLQIGNGGQSGRLGTGAVTNNAKLDFNHSDSYEVANAISSIGIIRNLNDVTGCTLTLTNVNISAGYIDNLASGDLMLTGNISGDGGVANEGSGTVTVTVTGDVPGNCWISNYNSGDLSLTGNVAGSYMGDFSGGACLTYISNVGAGDLTVHGNVSNGTAYNNGSGTLTITGNVTDHSSINISNAINGNLRLLGDNNTYTGGTVNVGGTISFASGGLGSSYILALDDATFQWLETGNATDISHNIYFTLYDGAHVTFDVGNNNVKLDYGFGSYSTASVIKTGSGTLIFAGYNTYTGSTTINDGILSFAHDSLDYTSSIIFGGGTLQWASGNTDNISDKIASISSGNTIKIDTNGNDVEFNHAMSGPGGLTKIGDGTLTLSTANTYTGNTTVSQGELSVTGSITSTVTVAGGATLSGNETTPGTGTIGAVTASGTVSPGVGGVGTLNTGNLVFTTGSRYIVNLTNSGADQINVTGTVNLGSTSLSVTSTRADIGDDVLVLIQNDGTDSIIGTFLNLSEGAKVVVGSTNYWITYHYNAEAGAFGNGYDVALLNFRPMAMAVSDTEIDLSWPDNVTATGYKIERMTDGSNWTQIATRGAGVTSYHDTELTEGTAFYYRVTTTINSADYYSGMANAITLPTAPTALAVTFVNGGEANLTWQDHSLIEAGYSIDQWIDGTWQQIQTMASGTGTMNVSIIGTFAPSTDYSFRVRAYKYDFSANPLYSLSSNDTETTADWPVAPTDLIATAVSDTEVDLSWTDTIGETGYKIERSTGGSTWAQIGTAAAGATSYNDNTVTEGEGTLRYYRIRATKNGVGDSASTDVISATTLPAKPTTLDAEIADGSQVNLTWDDNSSIETGYVIEQLMPDGVTWQEIQTTDAGTGRGTITVAVSGAFEPLTDYTFRVKAYQELGDPDDASYVVYSAPSNEKTVTALEWPEAPTGLTATAISTTQIDLSWTDYDTSQSGYTVERSENGTTWTLVTTINDPGVKECSDSGLTEGVLYYYRVQATNTVGGSGYSINVASTLLATPTGLQITAMSGSAVSLQWVDNSTNESGYSIQQLVGSEWQEIGWTAASATTATVEGTFEPSTEYSFRVQAQSDWSESQPSISAVAAPVAWPVAPTNLTATAVSGTVIRLSWTASTGASSYSIEQCDGESNNWSVIGTVNSPQTIFDATGLNSGGTEYSFRVAAVNSYGSSPFAAFFSVPTENLPPTVGTPTAGANPVTGTSTRLSVTASDDGGENNLTYTWSVVSTPSSGSAWFSENGSNAAKNTTVTFCAAGNYTFQVTVTDAFGASVTSSSLNVTVNQFLNIIEVTSGDVALQYGMSRQFTATARDQFYNDMITQPTFTWSVQSGFSGTISTSGLYTAPSFNISFNSGYNYDTGVLINASANGRTGGEYIFLREGSAETSNTFVNVYDNCFNQVDLSNYHGITRIAMGYLRTFGGPGPLAFDDFSFDTANGHFVINFDDLEQSTRINQYGIATFNSGLVENAELFTSPTPPPGTPGNHVCVQPDFDLMGVIFSEPVENLHFSVIRGAYSSPPDCPIYIWTPTEPIDLTISEHSNPTNSASSPSAVSAIYSASLYIGEDKNGTSTVDIKALLTQTFSNTGLDKYVHLKAQRSDGLIVINQDLSNSNTLADLKLQTTDNARVFVFTAWYDVNNNGQLDPDEYESKVYVYVYPYKMAIHTDYNGDGQVNATDDALNALYPTPVGEEGVANRTEVDLSALFGNASLDIGGLTVALDVTQGVDQLEFWDAPTGGNRLLPWGKNRMVKIYRIPVSGNFSEKVWISSTSQDATGPISFTLDILNNTGSIIAQTAKQNITVSQHSPVPYSLQDYLDTARIELARSGLSTAEQKVRLDVIKAAMSGLVPDIGDDRNPNLWDDSSGSYVARSGSSAVAAIDDIWIKHGADGIPSPPKIFCLKYSSLIMAEAYVMYFNSTGKAADVNQAKIAAINALIDHKVFPDELTNQGEGILWTSTTKEAGFQIRDLKPGDQVWFGNPYFTAEWKQKGWEMAKDHAINELGMSVADAEKYADNEIAGEGGSNVFYIGNGRVMSIYSKQVYTIAEYQQHIIDIFYTAKAAQANGKYVLLGDFQIKRVRSVVDPINL